MGATSTIPIVMVGVGDPVAYRIVGSLAEPGGNVTGAAYLDLGIHQAMADALGLTVPPSLLIQAAE